MPEIVEETKDTAMSAAKPGAAYGIARAIGGNLLGPVGKTAGGLAGSTMASGETQETLAALAISDGIEGLLGADRNTAAMGDGGGSQGVK